MVRAEAPNSFCGYCGVVVIRGAQCVHTGRVSRGDLCAESGWTWITAWERERKRERGKEWLRCPTPSNTREPAVVPLFPWRWGWAVCSKLRTVWDVRQGIMICGMREREEEEVNDGGRATRREQPWVCVYCILNELKELSRSQWPWPSPVSSIVSAGINCSLRAVWGWRSLIWEKLSSVSQEPKRSRSQRDGEVTV